MTTLTDITAIDSPPYVDQLYAMTVGQTLTQTEAGTLTSSTSSNGGSPTTGSAPFSFGYTKTFAGVESVTLPAGTYSACRFDWVPAPGALNHTWYLVGTGIVIKEVQTQEGYPPYTEQATSVKINGVPR